MEKLDSITALISDYFLLIDADFTRRLAVSFVFMCKDASYTNEYFYIT